MREQQLRRGIAAVLHECDVLAGAADLFRGKVVHRRIHNRQLAEQMEARAAGFEQAVGKILQALMSGLSEEQNGRA